MSPAKATLVWAAPGVAEGPSTPTTMVQAYEALADTILGVRAAEAGLVKALLDNHYRAAKRAMKRGDFEAAAAQVALFGTEGDNAVAGVRKRLQEGGHHFNADDAAEGGKFEPGFVIVNRKQKRRILADSKAILQGETEEARETAWADFAELADSLLK